MSASQKIMEGMRDAVNGRIARTTVFRPSDYRVVFDGMGEVVSAKMRVYRAGGMYWKSLPNGPRRQAVIFQARKRLL